MNIPYHVAIIMDGNGRWAKKKRKPRIFGHKEGMNRVRDIVSTAKTKGVKILSLFAFSSENWSRPKEEVNFLFSLLEEFIKKEVKELAKNNIGLQFIGDLNQLPVKYNNLIKEAENTTKNCDGMLLNIAISYGGKQEIINAVKAIGKDLLAGKISIDNINEETFRNYLYTKNMPEPDLLIRTSGEMRISNFMLWQLAYTEIYVTDTLWPDFNQDEFVKAIEDFSKRERRFGKISEQLKDTS